MEEARVQVEELKDASFFLLKFIFGLTVFTSRCELNGKLNPKILESKHLRVFKKTNVLQYMKHLHTIFASTFHGTSVSPTFLLQLGDWLELILTKE